MKIGIVIPVYKNAHQVERCIKAINDLDTSHDITVYEQDNNEENLGFTKAVNNGLRQSSKNGDIYTVVLNQDCYIREDFLDTNVRFMEEHPKCFISAPKQLLEADQDIIIHGGCTTAFPEGRHVIGRVSKGNCSVSKRMPWVNGACMMINMSLLLDVGLMDEGFFLIGSDSDWCYTARARHLEVWYVAEAVVLHEQGVSAKQSNKLVEFKKVLDMIYFRDKWKNDGLFKELEQEVFD